MIITCKLETAYSVGLLPGTTARRRRLLLLLVRNVNNNNINNINNSAGHGFSIRRHNACSSGHWSQSMLSGIQRNVCLQRRYAHTFNTQGPGPSVWSQSDSLGRASSWESSPAGSVSKPGPVLAHQSQSPGTFGYYHHALYSLLNALRQGDTLKLYFCLMRFVRGYDYDPDASRCFAEVVATIPPTTFSEILRCFDPYNVAKEIDTAPGINISYGAAVQTPLGELVNKWGVKLLYVRILNRLRRMQEARRHAHIRPLLNDCIVLMRCAAATSDIAAAQRVWHTMIDDGYCRWRHSEAFGEFVKARYLTEKLYANNDLARLRVRPLNLYRSSSFIPARVRFRLKRLVLNMTQLRRHRFGDNMHELYFAEPLTSILRKRDPLGRLYHTAGLRGMFTGDERLLCAFLKANGRNGRFAKSNGLLREYWGILVHQDNDSGTVQINGGVAYPPDSPRAPTQHLLDAIVHCYCCMGEITIAVKLTDFVSRRYGIPVPNKVWSDLLEYTRIMQTKPAANEWAMVRSVRKGLAHKAAKANTVLDVWDICTQEPHSFQPGMRDYYNLIKSLTRKSGSVKKPIAALRQVKPLYDDAVHAYEEAWCELLQTTTQHVPNHAAYRRYRVLRARKDHIWYCFHYASCQILKMIIPNRVDDDGGVREIPNLVGEFGQFMPPRIKYQVATGVVEFASGNSLQRNLVEGQQMVEEPQPISQRSHSVEEQRDQEELLEDQRDDEYWNVVEGHKPLSRDDMQMQEMDAGGPEQVGQDTAPNLDQEASTDMSSGIEEDSLDGDQRSPPPPHFDTKIPVLSTSRRTVDTQVADKPAYWFRPRHSTMVSIRQNGGEFTGYHDDDKLRHFAAHRVFRTTTRVAGVPVDLGLGSLSERAAAGKQKLPDVDSLAEQLH